MEVWGGSQGFAALNCHQFHLKPLELSFYIFLEQWAMTSFIFSSGNYSQALEDFQECLKLQVKHLDSDSRLLAETHYQLGLTYSLDLQYRQAVDQLNSSISVIKSRLGKGGGGCFFLQWYD